VVINLLRLLPGHRGFLASDPAAPPFAVDMMAAPPFANRGPDDCCSLLNLQQAFLFVER
jgi:hypothetical protein